MRKLFLPICVLVMLFLSESCKPRERTSTVKSPETEIPGSINFRSHIPFDSSLVAPFFISYPELAKYKNDVVTIYRKYNYNRIWFDQSGLIEFGNSLYSKVKELDVEGVSSRFPYPEKIEGIFQEEIENTLSETDTEIMLSCLFLFYAEKVYHGLDEKTTTAMEWFLPRKQLSYIGLLDSLLSDPNLIDQDEKTMLRPYYKLREVLKRYRDFEKQGGWNPIELNPKVKAYQPGDTAKAILQIRERLFVTGELKQNNTSRMYDGELVDAVKKFQIHHGFKPDAKISQKHIKSMNVPVSECIKVIMINMERFRWISPDLIQAKEFVFVNIPSYKLNLFRNGKSVFESPVVVGKSMTKTVIFSGNMSYIVFSPYWNLPQSIIKKEVKPGMAKNTNYLEAHNMEWNNGQVRQKPGKKNSLGLVKFMFPNSNDIYLHDTPSKNLFERESRAFSHGCIRVGKPRELAIEILKEDENWTPKKIDAAMNAGVEKWYTLQTKIPVYIGYFTVWVDEQGEINFFEDVYKRDKRLYDIMTN